MEVVNGVVEAISKKENVKTKFGFKTKTAFLVNGEWYGALGNKNNEEALALVKENDIVKIEYSVNGNFKNLETVEVIAENVPVEIAKVKKSLPKDVAKEVEASVQKLADKDLKITYNGSLKSAIEFVDLLMRNEMLPIPTKKADKADVVYEYVKEYTNRFVRDTYNAQLLANDTEKEIIPEESVDGE